MLTFWTGQIAVWILATAMLAVGAPGGDLSPAAPAEAIRVFVTVPPQAYFAERIGGPRVKVGVLVGPGQSPHTFEPTPKQVAELAKARLFFAIGWPFEERLLQKVKATSPQLKVIDTRQGLDLRRITGAEACACHTSDQKLPYQHSPGQTDPHIWLSPRLAKLQAATIANALAETDPAGEPVYRVNLGALQDDLDRLDVRLSEILTPVKGREFLVFHPAFGYFADAYGLRQAAVEIEGKEPGPRQLAAIAEKARAAGTRVIFAQPQSSPRGAEAVAKAIGGSVVPLDPLARDYPTNLEDIATKIRQALAPARPD